MNNKGSTLTNWVFLILGVSLFLVIFQTQVLNEMNETYGKNLSTGLSSDAQSNINAIDNKRSGITDEINSAEVSKTSDGLTVGAVGSITMGMFRILGDFVSGRFLSVLLTDTLDFPATVATVLMILIWISLIFIMVRLFMRGVTP